MTPNQPKPQEGQRTVEEIAKVIINELNDPWGSPIGEDILKCVNSLIIKALSAERQVAEQLRGEIKALEEDWEQARELNTRLINDGHNPLHGIKSMKDLRQTVARLEADKKECLEALEKIKRYLEFALEGKEPYSDQELFSIAQHAIDKLKGASNAKGEGEK